MRLSELETKKSGVIVKVYGRGAFRKRIGEMGFIRGREVSVIKNAPLQDPVEYSVMGYRISLRRAEASLIEVDTSIFSINNTPAAFPELSYEIERFYTTSPERTINVALVGNPNCGKTSIFNASTRSYGHVGNYGGVTVEIKMARVEHQGYIFNIYDLPGTYSLSSYSPEEVFVRNFLTENLPDVVVNVVDAANLERNLYLTTQLVDMNIKVVMALNMYDEMRNSGVKFNHLIFGTLTGIPVVPTVGTRGKGLARLFDTIIKKHLQTAHNKKKVHINYGPDIEESIAILRDKLTSLDDNSLNDRICPRYMAINLLENDSLAESLVSTLPDHKDILEIAARERISIEGKYQDNTENIITDYRYGFITGALRETFHSNVQREANYSEKIDNILTHKYFGLPVFFFFLWFSFIATFKLGQYPVAWIENGVSYISSFLSSNLTEGDFSHLLIDGIIGGVGGIIVFLPNIMILFFFISFMEDSGYMARAAFIMDKLMHRIGLHGKSFIPLVMGFGCNVPAIMSTRIIESRSNRILTILILPFMSCSARLPVYILIIGTVFHAYHGTILFLTYLTGIVLAVISALIFKRLFFRKDDTPFVMELPPYRLPTLRNTSRHMWNKAWQYLQKIGGVILVASIIIWGLNYYPTNSQWLTGKLSPKEELSHAAKESSYLERIGRSIEPVLQPLGFDWKITVSLLAGISAKEVVVSTMGVIYEAGNGETGGSLSEKLRNERYESGQKAGSSKFTPAVGLAFIMFTLIYFPCVAVVATVAKETGSMGWSVFMVAYTTVLAWIMSFFVFNIVSLIV